MYEKIINDKLISLKKSGQYRSLVTINRMSGQYTLAQLNGIEHGKPAIVAAYHASIEHLKSSDKERIALREVFTYYDIPISERKDLAYI